MTTSVLSSLKVSARPEIKQKPPVLNKRMKLINRLEQQKELATCMLEDKPFVAYKEKMVKDPETGERTKQRRQVGKVIRPFSLQLPSFIVLMHLKSYVHFTTVSKRTILSES